jgi:hypothetical protein
MYAYEYKKKKNNKGKNRSEKENEWMFSIIIDQRNKLFLFTIEI